MEQYNEWTVLREYRGENGRVRVDVRCSCGRESSTDRLQITSGRSKKCKSCAQKEVRPKTAIGPMPSARSVYVDYRHKAKDRGLGFELTFDEFLEVVRQQCYYCDREPSNLFKAKREGHEDFTYSGVDRIVNAEGYRVDNVVPCCKECNYSKRNMGINEFYQWACRIVMNVHKIADLAELYDEDFVPFEI